MTAFEKLSPQEKVEALSHLREILLSLADHRFKNFNMYLILIGIIGAGILNSRSEGAIYLLCFLAVAMSLLFFLSDIRAIHFLNLARRDLERVEPFFSITVHTSDRPRSQRRELFAEYKGRLISFTYTFRSTFLIIALAAIVCSIATATGLYEPLNRQEELRPVANQSAPSTEAPRPSGPANP